MFNLYRMNHRLQCLSFNAFRQLCQRHNANIADKNLKIILHIMKDNPHTVLNEDYHPILLIEITKETDQKVCNDFKPILEEYLIQEIK